jgi:hypothetical protein
MTFNLIDILLLVLVLLSVLGGYRRGFILGVLDLAGWVLSLLAGLRFYPPVGALAWRLCSLIAANLESSNCFYLRRHRGGRGGSSSRQSNPKTITERHSSATNQSIVWDHSGIRKWFDYGGNRLCAAARNPAQ